MEKSVFKIIQFTLRYFDILVVEKIFFVYKKQIQIFFILSINENILVIIYERTKVCMKFIKK